MSQNNTLAQAIHILAKAAAMDTVFETATDKVMPMEKPELANLFDSVVNECVLDEEELLAMTPYMRRDYYTEFTEAEIQVVLMENFEVIADSIRDTIRTQRALIARKQTAKDEVKK
jgi:hypothetical protein